MPNWLFFFMGLTVIVTQSVPFAIFMLAAVLWMGPVHRG